MNDCRYAECISGVNRSCGSYGLLKDDVGEYRLNEWDNLGDDQEWRMDGRLCSHGGLTSVRQ